MRSPAGEERQRPEILRFARLLRCEPEQLAFLLAVDDAELRVFRDQVTDTLFDAHAGVMKRMAAASRLLPAPVLAKIAEKVFGPLLCARIAGMIEPSKATDVAVRLPVDFLTDLAVELDPRRSHRVIGNIPSGTVVPIATALADRQDWITLGRFIGFLPDEVLEACLAALDDEQVLASAFAVDDTSAVPTVIDLLQASRLRSLVDTAAKQRTWPALLALSEQLRDDQLVELAEIVAASDREPLAGLLAVVAEQGLWDQLLPLAAALPYDAQDAVADIARGLAPEIRTDILRRARALALGEDLGPITDALEDEQVA